MSTENSFEEHKDKALSQYDVMPRFIKVGGIEIEQPDADGDFEIIVKDNDNNEIYRYLTKLQARKLVGFISHYLNEV